MVFPDRVKRLALTLDYTEGQALDYSVIDQPQKKKHFPFCVEAYSFFSGQLCFNYKTQQRRFISSVLFSSEVCYSYCSHNNGDEKIYIRLFVWKTNTECPTVFIRTHN